MDFDGMGSDKDGRSPYSKTNINPATTGEIEKGRSMMLRSRVRPRNWLRAMTQAAQRPNRVLRGRAIAVTISVRWVAWRKAWLWSEAKNAPIPS